MANVRKNHPTEFKAKVALEAIRQHKTIRRTHNGIWSSCYAVNLWKKQALAGIPEAFSGKRERVQDSQQKDIDELHRQIGQLIVERDWLKKSPQPCIKRQANAG